MNLGGITRVALHREVVHSLAHQERLVLAGAPAGRGHAEFGEKSSGDPPPVCGSKLASVSLDLHAPFRPVSRGATAYTAEATASCPTGHPVPVRRCRCGFHAARDVQTLLEVAACTPGELLCHAILDVDLGGRVVHHERGFRGHQQRVRKVSFLGVCQRCDLTREPPEAVAFALLDTGDGPVLVPRCADHADRSITMDMVVGLLGTDVAWIPTDEARDWLDTCIQWMGVP